MSARGGGVIFSTQYVSPVHLCKPSSDHSLKGYVMSLVVIAGRESNSNIILAYERFCVRMYVHIHENFHKYVKII